MSDTLERIERDARKDVREYWNCYGWRCYECPNVRDNQDPAQRYGVKGCKEAMERDLLRRRLNAPEEATFQIEGWTKDVTLGAAAWLDGWPDAVSCIKGGERREYLPERTCRITPATDEETAKRGPFESYLSCSECRGPIQHTNFCPHCGAKVMKEER